MKSLYSIFVIIAIVSFLGFAVENLWIGFTKGYIDNRNMMLPFLLGYGLAIAFIYLAFGTPHELKIFGIDVGADPRIEAMLYFIIVMLCVSLGEIMLGKSVEKLCRIKWWDYSMLPLHITQYTSVFTSIGFTMMIVLFMDKVFMPLQSWIITWDLSVLKAVAVPSMTVMTADFLHSAYYMYKRKSFYQIWKIDVSRFMTHSKKCLARSGKQ